jgi:hypothetical protein
MTTPKAEKGLAQTENVHFPASSNLSKTAVFYEDGKAVARACNAC